MLFITLTTVLLSILLGGLVAFAAYKLGSLSRSGALAAWFVGSSIFAIGGVGASVLLLVFFITGSLLTRLRSPRPLVHDENREGRRWDQVVANGIAPIIAVYALLFFPEYATVSALFFLGAISTATADTWATEIGSRWGRRPIDALTFQPVINGMSGGITLAGLIGSALGAVVIGFVASIDFPIDNLRVSIQRNEMIVVTTAGFLGAFYDSILGSALQARYRCNVCDTVVETSKHCATASVHIKGIPIIDNSMVNLITCIMGGLTCILLRELI